MRSYADPEIGVNVGPHRMHTVDMTLSADDQELWCVDVVLRALGQGDAEERVIELVRDRLGSDDPAQTVKRTYSYDFVPPDGSLGISCWIRAAKVGDAAEAGLRLGSLPTPHGPSLGKTIRCGTYAFCRRAR